MQCFLRDSWLYDWACCAVLHFGKQRSFFKISEGLWVWRDDRYKIRYYLFILSVCSPSDKGRQYAWPQYFMLCATSDFLDLGPRCSTYPQWIQLLKQMSNSFAYLRFFDCPRHFERPSASKSWPRASWPPSQRFKYSFGLRALWSMKALIEHVRNCTEMVSDFEERPCVDLL